MRDLLRLHDNRAEPHPETGPGAFRRRHRLVIAPVFTASVQARIRSLLAPGLIFCCMAHPTAAIAAGEAGACARNLAQLRQLAGDPALPMRWKEVSMSDGKPLEISITERDGSLFLEFIKLHEGLWAQGKARICRSDAGGDAQLQPAGFHLGPAAHWILRSSFDRGASLNISWPAVGEMRISTPGWTGTFAASAH
jgi:hypothetical protein